MNNLLNVFLGHNASIILITEEYVSSEERVQENGFEVLGMKDWNF